MANDWQPGFEPLPDFERLFDEHQSMVFSLALGMTGDRGLAEEIAQDVFLELDRNICEDRKSAARLLLAAAGRHEPFNRCAAPAARARLRPVG